MLKLPTRRHVLAGLSATAASGLLFKPALAQGNGPIKIGFVSPLTGPGAAFGEADAFVLESVRSIFADGIQTPGGNVPVEIIVRDSQTDPNVSAQVASDLILNDGVHLMIANALPETVNPVSDQCELMGIPCLSSVVMWQPWFYGRNGVDGEAFEWTYHAFWGMDDGQKLYPGIYSQIETNKNVGLLFENTADGTGWASDDFGLPPALSAAGYNLTHPSHFQPFSADFSSQINQFKAAEDDILITVCLPPDMATILSQVKQQNYAPKIVTGIKPLLFPSAVEALGDLGENLTAEIWWSPVYPYTSSLTGQTAAELAASYEAGTGRQWTQPLGFAHMLFEVAADIFKRADDFTDPASVRDALVATKLDTVAGNIDWSTGPVPNVAKVSTVVGGQWVKGEQHPYEIVVVDNVLAPGIDIEADLKPYT